MHKIICISYVLGIFIISNAYAAQKPNLTTDQARKEHILSARQEDLPAHVDNVINLYKNESETAHRKAKRNKRIAVGVGIGLSTIIAACTTALVYVVSVLGNIINF